MSTKQQPIHSAGNVLTGDLIVRVVKRFVAHLTQQEDRINDLNVFPVPDGDTGTNSLLTAAAGMDSLVEADTSNAGWVLDTFAAGCGMGARGNSGVILSEYLRGLAIGAGHDLTVTQWLAALASAAETAYGAVADPQLGTILSVAQDVAQVSAGESLEITLQAVAKQARASVNSTTELLPELSAAGVVDSGAYMLSLLHDAFAEEVSGHEMPELPLAMRSCDLDVNGYSGPAYEVMFLFDGDHDVVAQLKLALADLGDSLAISGGHAPWNVHVHVDDPSEAVTRATSLARTYRITVSALVDEINVLHAQEGDQNIAVVMVSHGTGIARLATESGAHVIHVPPRTSPATSEFVKAIRALDCESVMILPSDPDAIASAELAVRAVAKFGRTALVVPTRSTVESLAALAVCNFAGEADVVSAAMRDAASHVRSGAVTTAARASHTEAGPCLVGDSLGLVDGRIVHVGNGASIDDTVCEVIRRLVTADSELVTIIAGVSATHNEVLESRLSAEFPELEISVYQGDQPLWPYLIGVE